ncbi:MAG: leucine-rich repeat domain-containing protein [Ruminococcaceae bacterium]|nr:leucine-rich repeat domain-containing protein [Oscillospiraceae bacterium]
MKRTILRTLFIFICTLAVLFAVSATENNLPAHAAVINGQINTGISWQFDDETCMLTVSGNGEIPDFTSGIADWGGCSYETKEIVIGEGITYIGEYSFCSFFNTEKITLPSTLTGIGESAFSNCRNLASITLPDSLISIGEYAFNFCIGLTEIKIPSSVQSIGERAFCFCESLESLTIPASVTNIGDDAFLSCTNLKDITMPFSTDGNLFEGTAVEKLTLTGTGDMPTFVGSPYTDSAHYEKAAWYRFCDSLKTLVIAEGITSVGDYSFYRFSALESITLPDSVQTIGEYAFYDCSAAQELSLSASAAFEDTTFNGCESLVSLTMHKGTGTMQNFERYEDPVWYAKTPWYQSSDTFNTLVLEDGIKNIGKYAFYGCSHLANITLPADLTVIDSYAFSYSAIETLLIPDTVIAINDYAFYACYDIENLTMPASAVIYDSKNTFDCPTVKSVTLTAGTGTMPDYTEASYEYTPWYKSRNTLTNLTLCDGIQNIGAYAFRGLAKLTCVTIPDSIKTIGAYAFYAKQCTDRHHLPCANDGNSVLCFCLLLCTQRTDRSRNGDSHRRFCILQMHGAYRCAHRKPS